MTLLTAPSQGARPSPAGRLAVRAAAPAGRFAARFAARAAAAVLAGWVPLAQADEDAPRWEVGVVAFGVSQQAWPGASAQVRRGYPLPYAYYRGPVLRVDQDTVGLRAMKTPDFVLDVGFSGAFGSRAQDIPARRGMPDLGTLVEFGPRGTWQLGSSASGVRWQFELPLRGVFDVDARGASRGVTLEPQLQAQHTNVAGWKLTGSAAILLGDRRINDTVYGVAPRYASPSRPVWDGRAGLVAWRLTASASRAITPDWHVFGFARVDDVAGAANAGSPLVQQRTGLTAGVGLRWTVFQATRQASP